MPAFVPVFDPEVPRSEQDPNSEKLLKHRKWDNPHSVIPVSRKDNTDRRAYNLKYYRDKYNNNNSDNNLDDRFYRKPVRDDFDYAPRKKKKSSKPSHSDSDHRTQPDRKKVSKDLKKDKPERERK